jgi:hypothetical protein
VKPFSWFRPTVEPTAADPEKSENYFLRAYTTGNASMKRYYDSDDPAALEDGWIAALRLMKKGLNL